MNIHVAARPAATAEAASRLAIADCDIHPRLKSVQQLFPWLSRRWQEHLASFGTTYRQPWQKGPAYPKAQPQASRRDAWPPGGGIPGTDLGFMAAQHLDPNNVALGILNPLQTGQGVQNIDLSAAMCRATNEWQVAEWTGKDSRLRASVVVPYEDGSASAREIEHWAGNRQFAQVLLLSRTAEPLGHRRYWPIYEAAAAAGLPVAVHAFGYGGWPISAGGWGSFYIEEMVGHAQAAEAVVASLVLEGVFARVPALRVVMVEGGSAWAAALAWRMDKHWKKLRQEVPELSMAPSEYMRRHVWYTTQPIEEPEPRRHLAETMEWIGWDRILFATDYPHWDFDDPAQALPLRLTEEQRRGLFLENAKALYGVP
jgi:predicted TIM-barrel fold metal-dependent hydrolase